MDDYNVNVLSEAKNEYSSRLLNILTPLIIQGVKSIFNEAVELCNTNDEEEKYLMTFQNFLSRVPKWSSTIVDVETKRITEASKCSYLEDLLTCVHITQAKILTSIRVSNHQKKIEIDIPNLSTFIHNVYINFARKLYSNIYLFEKDIMPLDFQKNMRECELLCRESILEVVRESMPIEHILRSYMDETTHDEILEETLEKQVTGEEAEDMLEEAKKNLEKKADVADNELKVSKSEEKAIDDSTIEVETPELTKNEPEKPAVDATAATAATATVATAATATAVATNDPIGKSAIEDIKSAIIKDAEKEKVEAMSTAATATPSATATPPATPPATAPATAPAPPTLSVNTESVVKKPVLSASAPTTPVSSQRQNIKFNDEDSVLNMGTNERSTVLAPKTIERLEKISKEAQERERQYQDEEDYDDEDDDFYDDDDGPLSIGEENISLNVSELEDLSNSTKSKNSLDDLVLDDVEVLA